MTQLNVYTAFSESHASSAAPTWRKRFAEMIEQLVKVQAFDVIKGTVFNSSAWRTSNVVSELYSPLRIAKPVKHAGLRC